MEPIGTSKAFSGSNGDELLCAAQRVTSSEGRAATGWTREADRGKRKSSHSDPFPGYRNANELQHLVDDGLQRAAQVLPAVRLPERRHVDEGGAAAAQTDTATPSPEAVTRLHTDSMSITELMQSGPPTMQHCESGQKLLLSRPL
ncbi:hypothetical protein EYF80_047099 [Liparis tanakae]|uniref:Uncharacterized protein n=1 Tax=Liparis tanakae TaxID=230148 RepID=A0A4Z2FN84_9TELE|nr:hypothetical protein EYF80_047099 [Liparis tanakae]